MVGSIHHDLAVEITEHTPRQPDSLARLQHAASVFLRRCADPDVAQILLIDGPAVLGATWDELDQRWWQGPTEDLLREAMGDGSLVVADPTLLAAALLGSLTALGRIVAAGPNTVTQRQQAAATVLSTLVDGLRVHG